MDYATSIRRSLIGRFFRVETPNSAHFDKTVCKVIGLDHEPDRVLVELHTGLHWPWFVSTLLNAEELTEEDFIVCKVERKIDDESSID